MTFQADRPLGNVEVVSGRAGQEFSRPLHVAADNLLDKALPALDQGDRERAQRYVERAARIPFDDHEDVQPGLFSAHMTLFSSVTDALEDCDPRDDSWLDAALTVLDSCGQDARLHLLWVLDDAGTDLVAPARERRRIKATVAGVDAEAECQARLDDARTTAEQVILEVLDAVLRYEEALVG